MADIWRAHGWHVDIWATKAPEHATELARKAVSVGTNVVIAAGGDGTLGEIANGLAETDVILAPLPAGTSNSFARELGLPMPGRFKKHRLLQSAESLLHGRIQAMDLGYTVDGNENGRYWLLWAGAGADGFFVEQVEPRPTWSKKLGKLGYVMQGAGIATKFPYLRAKVEVDGRLYEGQYLLTVISICRYYVGGEVLLSPHAQLDDGVFEIWMFEGKNLVDVFEHLLRARFQKHLDTPKATFANGRHVIIHTDPIVACQTDGELAGYTPLNVQIKPRAIRILTPDTTPADLFSLPGIPLQEMFAGMGIEDVSTDNG